MGCKVRIESEKVWLILSKHVSEITAVGASVCNEDVFFEFSSDKPYASWNLIA